MGECQKLHSAQALVFRGFEGVEHPEVQENLLLLFAVTFRNCEREILSGSQAKLEGYWTFREDANQALVAILAVRLDHASTHSRFKLAGNTSHFHLSKPTRFVERIFR